MSKDLNVNIWGKAFKYAKNSFHKKHVTSTLIREDGTHTESVEVSLDLVLDIFVPKTPTKIDHCGMVRWNL